MESYILKFSACLFVFWLLYLFLLERQNMHHFKRFYLLGAVVLALIIPLFTITYYVEPTILNDAIETESMYLPIAAEPSLIDAQPEPETLFIADFLDMVRHGLIIGVYHWN